jgi:G3E family GTPase
MEPIKNIPVLLLTGYLGSGKTTLLNRILKNQEGIKFAVIVNDIGEVNIDADLIEKGGVVGQKDDSLVALQNGCICCTLKMDLVEQLRDITRMHRFDYIVIEASGICEPAPIAQTICSIPTLGPEYIKDGYVQLDCIVTVVDALRMRDEFKNGNDLLRKHIDEEDIENLVIQQIEFCNMILLNKASEVSKDELAEVRQIIRAIQPKAEIIECDYGNVELNKILHTEKFNFDEVATSATWIHELEHDHDDEGEAEEYGIGTFVYYARRPLNLGLFDEFVARKWPKNIIRAKGICYFKGEEDVCYVFEQAGRQVSLRDAGQWYATMPKDELENMMAMNPQLRKDWDAQYGDRMQKLVFIGQHLDKDQITEALDFCLV